MLGISLKTNSTGKLIYVDIDRIKPNPDQPRKIFESNALYGLAESIGQNGLLQPLTVRAMPDGIYELIAGERRLRACHMCGMREVPCIEVRMENSQSAVVSLLENLQREDLSCFEEAEGIAKLIEVYRLTQSEIAVRLGKTQSTIANKLRLLRLNPETRKRLQDAGLTERHARALLRLDDTLIFQAIEHIVEKQLNVAETDLYVDRLLTQKKEEKAVKPHCMPVIKDVRLFFNTVANAVNLMRQAGIEAETSRRDEEDYIEYVVRIPKSNPEANRKALQVVSGERIRVLTAGTAR